MIIAKGSNTISEESEERLLALAQMMEKTCDAVEAQKAREEEAGKVRQQREAMEAKVYV